MTAGEQPARVGLDEDRVLRGRQRWDDPTWYGALVGFTAGSAPLLVMYALWWQSEGHGPSSGPAFAGMMMLSGALGVAGGLDRGHPRWRPDEGGGAVSAAGVGLAITVA